MAAEFMRCLMTYMDDIGPAACVDCGAPTALIELESAEGFVCARCFSRRSPVDGRSTSAGGVEWSDADRDAWRKTAALAGQGVEPADCVADALASRGIAYREAGTWVWRHGAAYADIYASCSSRVQHRDAADGVSIERWVAEYEELQQARAGSRAADAGGVGARG